jgi:hypothetical protein
MRGTRIAAAVCAGLLTTGCGISVQTAPQQLPANLLPSPLPAPTTPATTPTTSAATPATSTTPSPIPATTHLRLWFVVDDGLAAVESSLSARSNPQDVLEALAAGPDVDQTASGLRTIARDPLTGLPLVSLAAIPPVEASPAPASGEPTAAPTFGPTPAAVSVRVSSAFTALPPAEQVLLLGQVVLSLSGAGLRSVSFLDEAGASLAVPLPDGRLLDVPATARDYAPLITQP